jgi:hypothetical protein
MLALTALLAIPSLAVAETRYASPTGSGLDPCDDPDLPCSIEDAVGGDTVTAGDQVVMLPGTYALGANGLGLFENISVGGQPGSPRPVITVSDTTGINMENNNGPPDPPPVLHDVELVHTGGGNALFNAGGVVERVIVTSTGTAACAVTGRSGVEGLIRDTICRATGTGGDAVGLELTAPGVDTVGQLRNVTAVAQGTGGTGILVSAIGAIALEIEAVNVIARGTASDVFATDDGTGGSSTITLARSNYATASAGGSMSEVTPAGTNGNQAAMPLFANALEGDFHQQATSPTVDAGTTDALLGERDLDDSPRVQNGIPDIGADELTPISTPDPPLPAAPGKKCKKAKKKKGKGKAAAKKKRCKKRKKKKKKK